MLTRRTMIALLGGSLAGAALGGCAARAAQPSETAALPPDRRWLAMLGQGLDTEFDYPAEIEGRLPPLTGTLYRNGPGLFERDGLKKQNLLDGDGMIRATSFTEGGARFRNRFVRTRKYLEEADAGRFLYPTWTSLAPELLDNIPAIPPLSQAGITPVVKGNVLYAFDEVGAPYTLDARTLETTGQTDPYQGEGETGPAAYKAHTKTDGKTGNWVLVGNRGRISPELHLLVLDRTGRQVAHVAEPSPRGAAYYHDFFWTGRHVVFHLHPALLSPGPMLIGSRPFADCLSWQPDQGSLLFVVDPSGERRPVTVEVPGVWMWHALNAYEEGNTIVADFIGYDAPDHFLGPEAAFHEIMQGREGIARAPGMMRRITIDLSAKRAQMTTVADGHFEFPIVHPALVGRKHRYGYAAVGDIAQGWFHDGVARIDMETGARTEFRFGSRYYVGEPVLAPDLHAGAPVGPDERGWLLCEVLDGGTGKSFIAVFDSARLAEGPVARVQLRHALPFSFHGWWEAV